MTEESKMIKTCDTVNDLSVNCAAFCVRYELAMKSTLDLQNE